MVEQGPYSPALIDAIAASDADVVAFHPYLYYPTVVGLPLVARRSLLHPAAHDEQPIRLPIFRETFAAAAGLVYWSEAERRFTERLFPVAARPQLVLGLGVESQPGDPANARRAPASATSRSCCAWGESTTARAHASSPNASRGTSTVARAT